MGRHITRAMRAWWSVLTICCLCWVLAAAEGLSPAAEHLWKGGGWTAADDHYLAVAAFQGPEEAGCTCSDAAPSGQSCIRLRDGGQCYETWVVAQQLCQVTCGRCFCPDYPCTCTDVPPAADYTCAQQAAWGQCDAPWMLPQHCQTSCKRCPCNNGTSSGAAASSSPQAPMPASEPADSSAAARAKTSGAAPANSAATAPINGSTAAGAGGSSTAGVQGAILVPATVTSAGSELAVLPTAAIPAGTAAVVAGAGDGTIPAAVSSASALSGQPQAGAAPQQGAAIAARNTPQLSVSMLAGTARAPSAAALPAQTGPGAVGTAAAAGGSSMAPAPAAVPAPGASTQFNLSSTIQGTNVTLGDVMSPGEVQSLFGGLQEQVVERVDRALPPPASPAAPLARNASLSQRCSTDILNFARGAGDVDLFLSFSAIAGWLSNLTDPDLAVTLLVPSNQAINNFVAEQGLDTQHMMSNLRQLKSVIAYHMIGKPMSYIDLLNQGRPIATYLPGASLSVRPLSGVEVEVQGVRNSARLIRSNILLCHTVVHVIDAVLLPAGVIDNVMPYDLAVGGIGTASQRGTPPGVEECAHTVADAVRGNPNLTLATVLLQLGGWLDEELADPSLNVTLFIPNDEGMMQSSANLLQPGRQLTQQAMAEVLRSTPLLRLAGLYMMVAPAEGGLSLAQLEQLDGELLPTEAEGHDVQVLVGEAGGQERQLEVLGEMGNVTAKVVQPDIRTCGGAVIHIISDSISANYSREELESKLGRLPEVIWAAVDQQNREQQGGGGGQAQQQAQQQVRQTQQPQQAQQLSSMPAPALPTATSPPSQSQSSAGASTAVPAASLAPPAAPQPPVAAASASPAAPGAAAPTASSLQQPAGAAVAPAAATGAAGNSTAGTGTTGAGGSSPAATSNTPGCLPSKDLFTSAPEFQKFQELIVASKVEELAPSNSSNNSSQPGMTVLAPLNSAIDTFMGSLDSGTQSALMASPRAIVALLAYHAITPPPLRVEDMRDGMVLSTLAMDAQGNHLPLTVRRSPGGPVRLNGIANSAAITLADIAVCEGIVHAVDAIILPVRVQAMDQGAASAGASAANTTATSSSSSTSSSAGAGSSSSGGTGKVGSG